MVAIELAAEKEEIVFAAEARWRAESAGRQRAEARWLEAEARALRAKAGMPERLRAAEAQWEASAERLRAEVAGTWPAFASSSAERQRLEAELLYCATWAEWMRARLAEVETQEKAEWLRVAAKRWRVEAAKQRARAAKLKDAEKAERLRAAAAWLDEEAAWLDEEAAWLGAAAERL